MRGKAENYVGGGGIGREVWDVEGVSVRGVHPCSIWEAGDDGCGGWENIGGRQKMAGGARIKDGPSVDGGGISVDCLLKDRSCKGIIAGGDRMRAFKINIGIYFTAVIVRP